MDESECLTLTTLLNETILPKFDCGFDRPLSDDDFTEYASRLESAVLRIYENASRISDITNFLEPRERNKFIIQLLILCGENSEISPWCCDEIQQMCSSILSSLLSFNNYSNLVDFLTDSQGKFLRLVLQKLKPFLLKNTWKEHPTAVTCYSWVLMHLKMPFIDDNLPALLPTALIVTDDFVIEYKITGVKCLHHIINNSTSSALKENCYDQVIFKTLELGYSDKDANLIPELTSCTLTLLSKMYLHQSNTFWKSWSNYDVFLDKYCLLMRMEANNDMKKSYMRSLSDVIECCNLATVRFLKNLIVIFDEYAFSPSTVIETLQAMEKTAKVCLPRGTDFIEDLLFIVFKIIYSPNSYKSIKQNELDSACIEFLATINSLRPEVLSNLRESPDYVSLDSSVHEALDKVSILAS